MAHVVRYDLTFWDASSKEDSRRMIEEEWKRHPYWRSSWMTCRYLSHHCSRMLDLLHDAAQFKDCCWRSWIAPLTIRKFQHSKFPKFKLRGQEVEIYGFGTASNVAEWLALIGDRRCEPVKWWCFVDFPIHIDLSVAYFGMVMVEVMKAHESAVISANRFTTVRLMSGFQKDAKGAGRVGAEMLTVVDMEIVMTLI